MKRSLMTGAKEEESPKLGSLNSPEVGLCPPGMNSCLTFFFSCNERNLLSKDCVTLTAVHGNMLIQVLGCEVGSCVDVGEENVKKRVQKRGERMSQL